MTLIQDQPPPKSNQHPDVWQVVIADMMERHDTGLERYGTTLQPFNGRDALVDAYQEALDLAVYLRQAILERAIDPTKADNEERTTAMRHTFLQTAKDHPEWLKDLQ